MLLAFSALNPQPPSPRGGDHFPADRWTTNGNPQPPKNKPMKLINISLPAGSVAGTFGVRVADHAPGWSACGSPVNPANGTNHRSSLQ